MSALKLKVLISGAGIAGPALAYWLARSRHAISVTIVERSPIPRVTGQSIDLRGPAIEIMKKMNLEEAVRARTTTETGTSILDTSGRTIAQFEAGKTFTADYEILRADLSELLLDATNSLSNVRYMYGDSIKTMQQTEKNVDVIFAGGSKETFDVVVAADGATSRTRPMILDEHILKDGYKPLGQYIAFFSIPSQPSDDKTWQWYNVPKGLCVMRRPHRNGTTVGVYLSITMPGHGNTDPVVEVALQKGVEAQKRVLRQYFENVGWEAKRVLDGMENADDFYMSRAAHVELPKWTNGRALVVGDAAFAAFGVGTSLAIESAYVLAGELSKIQNKEDVPRALERYEEVFRPMYTKISGCPPGYPQLAFPQTAWGLSVRNSLLWFISKTKLYKVLSGGAGENVKFPDYDLVA